MTSVRAAGAGRSATVVLWIALGAALLGRVLLGGVLGRPQVEAWLTVFAAVCIQASPFVVLGVLVSALVSVAVPAGAMRRVAAWPSAVGVPAAAAAGALLPGCECGSVPVAVGLLRRGVRAGPAFAFMLSAPAVNPVVLAATAIAFPHRPELVIARGAASTVVALAVGAMWSRLPGLPVPRAVAADAHRGRRHARAAVERDLGQALGLLVIGAAGAATVGVVVPPGWLDLLSSHGPVGVLVLSVLAVVLAVCSESDAFVASSLTGFSATAQLAFMVVGPVVDLKLIAMQWGAFGRGVAVRLVPLAFVTAVASAAVAGAVLL